MSSNNVAVTALNNRVWYVEGGVHPTRAPQLLVLGKFSTDPSRAIGEAKRIAAPDPNNFQRDIQVGTVKGERERAQFGIGIRSTVQASIVLGWLNSGCRVDIFALTGKCGNPQDFTDGSEKITYFPDGQPSKHNYDKFGAWDQSEDDASGEMLDMTSQEYYELRKMRQDPIGGSSTVREIYTVDVWQGDDCEDCPDRCAKVLATMKGASATPGTKPSLLYSADGGETFSQQDISTLFSNEDIADGAVIGGDLVLISNVAHEIHWTNLGLLYNGTNSWQQVGTGFLASKAPNAMWSVDVRHTWIVGNGGYVYFCKNYKVGVDVQDAGVATSQHLRSVHGFDTKNVLAVGDNNAVVLTTNGGTTWESIVGPAVGINLSACWMWNETTWFVGEGANGNGKLWLTTNSGKTWSQVGLPSTYLRIRKIVFVSEAEGYIAAETGGTGVVLRTILAGYEWVTLPQGKEGVALENAYISDLAVCSKYSNTAYAAGLADNSSAGVIYKFGG